MNLPPPRGVIGSDLLGKLDDLAPIPALTVIPARITTPPLFMAEDFETPQHRAIDELMSKVRAEDERMRRLLPAPPRGMYWESELQSREPDYNFTRDTADVVVRLVYRLRPIGGE